MRPRRSAGYPGRTRRAVIAAAAFLGVSSLLIVGTAQAEEAPAPAAQVFASNARGGCTLDVWGSTNAASNIYLNGRRSFFLEPGPFEIEMDAENGVESVNTIEVRYLDSEVLAEYAMTADCDEPEPVDTPRPSKPTPTATPTPDSRTPECGDRCGTRAPLPDPAKTAPPTGLASTG